MNQVILGLIFDIVGVLIITITEIINPVHSRREDVKWWDKRRYGWSSWRPFYKNTQTLKWIIKWNHRGYFQGIIPPKIQLTVSGLLLILIGFILQI